MVAFPSDKPFKVTSGSADICIMLEVAANVRVSYEALPHGQGWLVFHAGAQQFRIRRIDEDDFKGLFRRAKETPQRIGNDGRHTCWLYRDQYFWAAGLPAASWELLEQGLDAA
jgi:hypothetical protein